MLTPVHPAQRFRAPTSITAGVPLKRLLDRHAVVLLGESFAAVVPGFDARRFRGQALRGLQPLEFMERAAHLARALGAQLPQDFAQAGPLVIASLGPPLTTTAGNGLAPFFYLPHSQLIATQGLESPEVGLQACYALTRRFTAEFAIRPYLLQHRELTLQMLATWVSDPDPHVRRDPRFHHLSEALHNVLRVRREVQGQTHGATRAGGAPPKLPRRDQS